LKNLTWDEQSVRAVLHENSFTYQNVDLPFGLKTGGDDRSQTADLIFPADMAGKSVFDLGTKYGFFCFKAEDRGASPCVGVDIDKDNVRKSSLLASIRGSAVEFRRFDIETDQIGAKYDFVLCLNVLHHLRNPLSALDKLIAATRDSLVLEVAAFARRDRKKNGLPWPIAQLLMRLPVLLVARNSSQTFFVTPKALRALIIEHRADFARLDFINAGHKGRYIAIARRRRIGRLFVVAGLQAAGKSTMIAHMTSPAGVELAESLGFDQSQAWTSLGMNALEDSVEPDLGDVILHYNVSMHLIDGDRYHHSRTLADLMAIAREVTVVTVACPRERLRDQFKGSRMHDIKKSMLSARRRKKLKKLLSLYERPESLKSLYADWLDFLSERGLRNFVVASAPGGYRIADPAALFDNEAVPISK
jgi:2-polyprenyl-3-methyl-5-hydroxy-6-metoxy-1,4-benzoquinol methylase